MKNKGKYKLVRKIKQNYDLHLDSAYTHILYLEIKIRQQTLKMINLYVFMYLNATYWTTVL